MRIKQILKRLYIVVFNLCSNLLRGKYTIEGYKLSYPLDFTLPYFQRRLRLYDRFLPVLARQVEQGQIIIDVGANVGDTTLAFIGNSGSDIVSIEASDKFIQYLESTVAQLPVEQRGRVRIIKTFVGSGELAGGLDHSGGTATLSVSTSDESTHTPLDELVSDSDVGLIKVDVDGFDYDVLLSAQRLLKSSHPILFWENVVLNEFQFEGYNKLYKVLESLGYDHIWIFDNRGNIMEEHSEYNQLKLLSESLLKRTNPNLGYIDVLACTDADQANCIAAIEEFKKEYSTT